jgi:long-chain acyl-CoA synthetase
VSEAGGVFENLPDKRKPGSVGTSFKHMEICILNEHGLECHTGEDGEIFLKGKSLGIGYLNEQGAIDRYPDQGLPTGDLGYMDSEDYAF